MLGPKAIRTISGRENMTHTQRTLSRGGFSLAVVAESPHNSETQLLPSK